MALMTASGGLSNSKLALANAGTEDVLNGKTFYSGDKEIKTGLITNNGAWSSSIEYGQSVIIPQGYHNGAGTVSTKEQAAVYLGYVHVLTTNTDGSNASVRLMFYGKYGNLEDDKTFVFYNTSSAANFHGLQINYSNGWYLRSTSSVRCGQSLNGGSYPEIHNQGTYGNWYYWTYNQSKNFNIYLISIS